MQSVIGALRVVLGADIAQFEEGLQKATQRLSQVGEKMRNMGGVASAAVSAPLALLGKTFVDAASDAEEFGSAFNYLFKDNADSVRSWADTTAKEIGRSSGELQKQSQAFMQLFKQVNDQTPQGAKNAAELSKQFTLLAQDLSSFFNVAESDALDKLRSGLAGETEPLRDFGVFLNEAAVEAKGFEMGLEAVDGKLTEQSKVLARAALILEKTKDAQGDAARTSGSYANQVRKLSAAWTDLSKQLGQILLPLASKIVEALTSIAKVFGELPEPVQKFILVVGGIAVVLGPVVAAIGMLAMGLGAVSAPVLAIIAALAGTAGLIAAFAAMGEWADTIKGKMGASFTGIGENISAFGESVAQGLGVMKEQAGQVLDWLLEKLTALGEWFSTTASAAIDAFVQDWQELSSAISTVMQAIGTTIANAWESAKSRMEDFGEWISDKAEELLKPLVKAWTEFSDWLKDMWKTMLEGAGEWVQGWIDKLQGWLDFFAEMKDKALEFARALYDGLKEWLSDKLRSLIDTVKSEIDRLIDKFRDAYEEIVGGSIVPDMVVEVGQWMNRLAMQMPESAQDAAGGVVGALGDMADRLGGALAGVQGVGATSTPAVASLGAGDAPVREQTFSITMPLQMVDPGSPFSRRQAARDMAMEVMAALGR